MKINPIMNPNVLKSYQATKSTYETSQVAIKRDEVTFSEEALSFSKAMAEAKDAIELRTPEENARIADVKAAVRQGTYRVGSDEIAGKILESVLGRK